MLSCRAEEVSKVRKLAMKYQLERQAEAQDLTLCPMSLARLVRSRGVSSSFPWSGALVLPRSPSLRGTGLSMWMWASVEQLRDVST